MKTERGQLEHYLRLTIEENALNTKVHDQVKEFFKQKHLARRSSCNVDTTDTDRNA